MYSYIVGTIFLIVSFIYLYFIGKSFVDEKKSYPFYFIIGYIIFTCIVAIGGLMVQLLQINLKIYYGYYTFVIILLGYYAYRKNKHCVISKESIKEYFKKYYFMYILLIILILFNVINFDGHWMANHTDDAYYMNLVANYGKTLHPFLQNPSTGLLDEFDLIRRLSTFELEWSYYIYMFKLEPTVFCRVFASGFNYFVVLNGMLACAFEFVKKMAKKIDANLVQYSLIPILFFSIHYRIFEVLNILQLQDMWQFNSAMWYGSSVVRIAGFYLCLVPIISADKIKFNCIVYYVLVSIVLVTRAGQALPLLMIVALSYFIAYLFKNNYKKTMIVMFVTLLVLAMLPFNGNQDIYNVINYRFDLNVFLPLMILCYVLFVFTFTIDNETIKSWNFIVLMSGILIFVPRINNLFVIFAQYDFVAARTITTWVFVFITTIGIEIILYLCTFNYNKNTIVKFFKYTTAVIFIGISISYIYTSYLFGGSVINMIKHNPNIAPQALLDVSESLEDYALKHDQEINVLSPKFMYEDNMLTSFNPQIRIKAPHVISISALTRFEGAREDSIYSTYSQDIQDVVEEFISGKTNDPTAILEIIESYLADCVVLYDESSANVLLEHGFELFEIVESRSYKYYVVGKVM